jgi:putative phosphoesterase
MKLGIISDTHGSLGAWDKSLRVLGDVDLLFHAGDVLYHGPRNPLPYGYDTLGLAKAISQYPGRIVIARGNCDADIDQAVIDVPIQAPYVIAVVNDLSIMVLHGHMTLEDQFPELMKRYGLDFIVTGHTHVPSIAKPFGDSGGVIINPGSPALPKTTEGRGTCALIEDKAVRIIRIDDGSELMTSTW